MELYNSIIRKVEELAAPPPPALPYDPQGAWEDTGSFELVMLRDAAYELGGSSKPAVNFTWRHHQRPAGGAGRDSGFRPRPHRASG